MAANDGVALGYITDARGLVSRPRSIIRARPSGSALISAWIRSEAVCTPPLAGGRPGAHADAAGEAPARDEDHHPLRAVLAIGAGPRTRRIVSTQAPPRTSEGAAAAAPAATWRRARSRR